MLEKPTIVLMLKAPWPGLVKTRLAQDLGPGEACRIYRIMVERLASSLPKELRTEVHFSPAGAGDEFEGWLGHVGRAFPQSDGDLGTRLISAMRGAAGRGAQGLVFLGGDCPYVDTTLLRIAVAKLQSFDAVIGPATDGGYYLLGMNRPEESLFTEIPWSTSRVLSATIRKIDAMRWTRFLLPELEDVDDIGSWNRARVLF